MANKHEKYYRAFVILNHTLLPEQIEELQEKFGVQEIVTMPDGLAARWRQITPDRLKETAEAILKWVRQNATENAKDMAVVQGHSAATSYLVTALAAEGIDPFYAHSKRIVQEVQKPDGTVEKKAVFKHEGFYRYEMPENIYAMRKFDSEINEFELAGLGKDDSITAIATRQNGRQITIVPNWFTEQVIGNWLNVDVPDGYDYMEEIMSRIQEYEDYMAEEVSSLFWNVADEVAKKVVEEIINEEEIGDAP